MKKIIIPIFLVLIILLGVILIFSNNKKTDIEFYTIPENYSFVEKDNNRINLYVYSLTDDPLISYPDRNSYQLKLDTQSVTLLNVECETHASGDYYLVDISADVPNITETEYLSQSCILHIINGSYTLDLDMGSFSIIDSSYYKLISLDSLSGSYSTINGVMNLAGINIGLSGDFSYMTSFRIGGFTYGTLSKSKFNLELDNEIDIETTIINYKYNQVEESYTLGMAGNKLFIPVGYIKYALVRYGYMVIELDGNKYYFDAFPFMTTNPNYKKYESIGIKGEITNAQAY